MLIWYLPWLLRTWLCPLGAGRRRLPICAKAKGSDESSELEALFCTFDRICKAAVEGRKVGAPSGEINPMKNKSRNVDTDIRWKIVNGCPSVNVVGLDAM